MNKAAKYRRRQRKSVTQGFFELELGYHLKSFSLSGKCILFAVSSISVFLSERNLDT